MTQQDDITQRLRDNADLDEAEHGNARVVKLEREAADEIERLRAELSKLRAPVAEPAIVGWRDPDCGRMAQKGPPHGYNRYSEALMTVAEHRALMAAALASAPVAGADRDADERAVMTPAKAAYVEHFGHAAGWLSYKGSWFIEGFKAGQKSAPVAGEAQPVGRVRHFNYSGVARNGFSQEAVLNDDAPTLPDGALLYAAPQASAEPTHKPAMSVAEFCAEAGRLGLTADTLAAQLSQRPEFADCLPQADKDGGQQRAGDVRDTALSNLIWAASERDKGNRIRQFDQFMDEARAAISSNAAKQGSRDE